MLTRLIATVAALLLACASPQAQAHVRAERVSVSLADLVAIERSAEDAPPAKTNPESKTAPPARATVENSAPRKNAALSHCRVGENWSPLQKCASMPGVYQWDGTRLAGRTNATGTSLGDYQHAYGWAISSREGLIRSTLHTDVHGTPQLITDGTGAIAGWTRTDVWGVEKASTGAQSRLGHTGYLKDPLLGDELYAQARQYRAGVGRFTSRDPWEGDVNNPVSLNPYLYGFGNPGSYVDPDGQVAYLSEWEKDTAETVEGYDNEIDQAVEQDAGGRAFWLGVGRGLAWVGNKVVGGLNATSNLVAQGLYDGETYAQAERELSVNRLAMTDGMESTHQTAKVIAEDPKGAAVAVHGAAVTFATDVAMGDPRALSQAGQATGLAIIPGAGGKGLKFIGESVDAARLALRIDGDFIPASVADEVDLSSLPAAKAGKDPSMVETNKSTGDAARDVIAENRPGSVIEQNFLVTGGLRRVDILDGTTAIESKVGRTSLTPAVRQELARDIKMLRSGKVNVNAVEWHFSRSPTTGRSGPTGPLRAKLNQFGIPIVEYP